MSELKEKKVSLDGVEIDYYSAGKGQPVVFLHGLTGSASSWLEIVKKLSRSNNFAYFLPDMPGLGYAGKINGRYKLETDVEFLEKFLEKMEIGKFVLIGDSSSGIISLKYALRHPRKVEKLILIETPFYFAHRKLKVVLLFGLFLLEKLRLMQFILKRVIDSDRLLNFFWCLLWPSNEFLPTFAENRDVVVLRKNRVKNYSQAMIDLIRTDLRKEIAQIEIPTLVIAGDSDFWVPRFVAQDLARGIPNAKLLILKKVGHGGFDDEGQKIVKKIKEFIRQKT